MRKLTDTEFKERAEKKHGKRYDYSKVDYFNGTTKVEIICKEHGSFWQTPHCHLQGQGCPDCGFEKIKLIQKTDIKEFVNKSNIKHNFKYDYTKVNYINSFYKVEIICKEHGSFWQKPVAHLRGQGCPKCGKYKRNKYRGSGIGSFIEKANPIHGFKYDYSKVNYINSSTKVEIICKDHGSFWQTPNSHLNGSGCPICAGNKKSFSEEFAKKSNIKHNFKYDYSKVIYKSAKEKVEIICPKHGSFWQTPDKHLGGRGCPECKFNKLRQMFSSNTKEFIDKANIKHDYKYNYTKVIYKNNISKVEIICPAHGSFFQTPGDHLTGYGCPKCSHYISKPEILWLDSLGIPNDKEHRNVHIKIIGVMRAFKVDGFDPITNSIYEFNGDFWHGNPEKFNPEELNKQNHKTFGELYQKTLEKERLLKSAGYNIISIWESDFNKQLKIK